ncbi:MAG: amidohydrolase family protein [Pirellulales bacterium]
MNPACYALRARWVIPVAAAPIEGGVVTIRDGKIAGVARLADADVATGDLIDLGDVALLPGFVNAHTHLEFSDLAAPLGHCGIDFCGWVPLVAAERRRAGRDADVAVRAGMGESARYGVTAIGEIAQRDWSPDAIESVPLAVNVYLELIGLAADRVDELCASARQHVDRVPPPNVRWRTGVSPHAPYSVHFDVVRRMADLPLAMHVAESREELELLATATGAIRDMLVGFGVWRDDVFGGKVFGGKKPVDFLRAMAGGVNCSPTKATTLVVHGNYLDAEAMDFLAAADQPMYVVYCPRTHAYFGHEPYPLAELLRRDIPVAIGTDSRASNPDLSVLAELRYVAEQFPAIPLERILAMGTTVGAAALMRGDECGSIEVGKTADLVAVWLDGCLGGGELGRNAGAIEQVFHSRGDVVATVAAGKVVYDPHGLIRRVAMG